MTDIIWAVSYPSPMDPDGLIRTYELFQTSALAEAYLKELLPSHKDVALLLPLPVHGSAPPEEVERPTMHWPHVHEAVIRWCAQRACELYGSKNTFNSANFSNAWQEATGAKSVLDGGIVCAMLCGRDWLTTHQLDDCYWTVTSSDVLKTQAPPSFVWIHPGGGSSEGQAVWAEDPGGAVLTAVCGAPVENTTELDALHKELDKRKQIEAHLTTEVKGLEKDKEHLMGIINDPPAFEPCYHCNQIPELTDDYDITLACSCGSVTEKHMRGAQRAWIIRNYEKERRALTSRVKRQQPLNEGRDLAEKVGKDLDSTKPKGIRISTTVALTSTLISARAHLNKSQNAPETIDRLTLTQSSLSAVIKSLAAVIKWMRAMEITVHQQGKRLDTQDAGMLTHDAEIQAMLDQIEDLETKETE